MKETEVEESTEYDNCLDIAEREDVQGRPAKLFDDDDLEGINDAVWKKHWNGMPEFQQDEKKPYKTIYVHFRTEEDYKDFVQKIEQPIGPKAKSIWHPKLARTQNSLLRWFEDDS